MAQANDEFKYESLQDRETIVKYLNALKDGFIKGKISLGNKEKKIVLEPKGLLSLEVRAKKKNDRVKIALKVSWKTGTEENILKIDTSGTNNK